MEAFVIIRYNYNLVRKSQWYPAASKIAENFLCIMVPPSTSLFFAEKLRLRDDIFAFQLNGAMSRLHFLGPRDGTAEWRTAKKKDLAGHSQVAQKYFWPRNKTLLTKSDTRYTGLKS